MNYWVAYKRGSFSIKEQYASDACARLRSDQLRAVAHFIRVVVAAEGNHPALSQCLELPAVANPCA
jgi:hypothetical protein